MLRKSLAASGLTTLLIAVLASPVAAAPLERVACAAPTGGPPTLAAEPSALASAEAADAYAAADDAANARADTVQREVDAAFGVGRAKERIADQLRRGLIGTAVDLSTGTSTVVVTPGRRSELAGAKVIAGCHSAEALIEADDVLVTRDWHPQAGQASFSFSLQASDSRFHVEFDRSYPEVAKALQARLGDRVVVTLGDVGRSGRLDDGKPHFGGAGIRENSGSMYSNACTAGFTVRRNSDGWRGGMTAGHCFSNGMWIYSGPKPWGYSWGEYQFPTYDMMGIGATGSETYDNVIHTDSCCPVKRDVIGYDYASVGELVCLSGMVTKAICSVQVTSTNGYFCDAYGCTGGLIEGIRNNQVIVRPGDSGAPIYTRYGSNAALAMGMVIAAAAGGTIVYGEHIAVIESHLGVSVLTS